MSEKEIEKLAEKYGFDTRGILSKEGQAFIAGCKAALEAGKEKWTTFQMFKFYTWMREFNWTYHTTLKSGDIYINAMGNKKTEKELIDMFKDRL